MRAAQYKVVPLVKLAVAIATNTIHAHLDHQVPLDPMALMANTVRMAPKVQLVLREPVKDTLIHLHQPDANNARLDPKDHLALLVPLDLLEAKVNPDPRAVMANPVAALVAQPAAPAPLVPMASLERKEMLAQMLKSVRKALLEAKVTMVDPVQPVPMEIKALQANQDQPVQLARLEDLAKVEKMEIKDPQEQMAFPAAKARMRNIVLAQEVDANKSTERPRFPHYDYDIRFAVLLFSAQIKNLKTINMQL
jgi:hypothetical protein